MTLNLVLRYKKNGDISGGWEGATPVRGIGEHVMISIRLIRVAGLKVIKEYFLTFSLWLVDLLFFF